jgi:hypothetical protein
VQLPPPTSQSAGGAASRRPSGFPQSLPPVQLCVIRSRSRHTP